MPEISLTASRKGNALTVTLSNPSADSAAELCLLAGKVQKAEGRLLTGAMDAHNDFDRQTAVAIQPFAGVSATDNGVCCTLPPCSVAELTLTL